VFVTELSQQTFCAIYFLVIYFLVVYSVNWLMLEHYMKHYLSVCITLKHHIEHLKTSTLEFQYLHQIFHLKIYLYQIFLHTVQKYIYGPYIYFQHKICLKQIFYIFSNNILHPSNFESYYNILHLDSKSVMMSI